MTEIYIDITQYVTNRLNTGIQRVINEYLKRAVNGNQLIYVIFYDKKKDIFLAINDKEINLFLNNVSNYEFNEMKKIDIFSKKVNKKIFFDIDSIWNSPLKREELYKELKRNNFLIYNMIYDLIPILFPKFMYKMTIENFKPYIKAIFKYSDFVFFDSYSALNDFLAIQKEYNYTRTIKTKVAYLGSDFKNDKKTLSKTSLSKYKELLSKKYILFVGTIEPRKNQELMLDAFDILYKEDPDLNLIFIGKTGWNVEKFVNKLSSHSLNNKNVHHLNNIDDDLLVEFYKSAFIVTYLSHYEGYGLPIVESLYYGNITIVSKNSSMPEVGLNFADYIKNNSKDELINLISNYLGDEQLYRSKRYEITSQFRPRNWDVFYEKISKYLI